MPAHPAACGDARRRQASFVLTTETSADFQLCSQKEQEFAQEYNASLDKYMNDIGLDLTSDQKPPRGMFIDVLAMEDVGTIVTDSGMSMTLKKVRAAWLLGPDCVARIACPHGRRLTCRRCDARTRCTASAAPRSSTSSARALWSSGAEHCRRPARSAPCRYSWWSQ